MHKAKQTDLQHPLRTQGLLSRTLSRLFSLRSTPPEKDHRVMDSDTDTLEQTQRTSVCSNETEIKSLTQNAPRKRFVVSSLFLHECFLELTADNKEQFFFITGSETDDLLVLDQKCGFEHVSRTPAGVEGELKSTHTLLCKLEQFGHRLLAHFHSHPGCGPGATLPSSIDRGFQERLERGGYPTVAAVFSRDGLVRFFRLDSDFELQIYGKGVEEIEPHLFHLTRLA